MRDRTCAPVLSHLFTFKLPRNKRQPDPFYHRAEVFFMPSTLWNRFHLPNPVPLPTHLAHPLEDERAVAIHMLGLSL
jgi:hypothetical protein